MKRSLASEELDQGWTNAQVEMVDEADDFLAPAAVAPPSERAESGSHVLSSKQRALTTADGLLAPPAGVIPTPPPVPQPVSAPRRTLKKKAVAFSGNVTYKAVCSRVGHLIFFTPHSKSTQMSLR